MKPMRDADVVEFLQWALPRLRMRWAGFRRVRNQVRKRIADRLRELDLPDLYAYRSHLESEPDEWGRLDSLCRVTISRFYRDRAVWDRLGDVVLPRLEALARRDGADALHCLSIGCASGEEPYTLALVWGRKTGVAAESLPLRVVAVDASDAMLLRARRGVFGESSLRDLPDDLRGCFAEDGAAFRIDPAYREPIDFVCQDVRHDVPSGPFYLVLCRNLIFTYYERRLQRVLLERIARCLVPGGALTIGIHESLPQLEPALFALDPQHGIHVRRNET